MKKIYFILLLSFAFRFGFSQTVIIGTGTGISAFSPLIRSYDYCIYEVIYPAAEIGMAGTISRFAFERVDGTNTDPIDSVRIYMQHTGLTDLTAGTFSTNGYELVFEGSFPNDSGSGWREVVLTNPFVYDGINNLQVLAVKGYQPAVGNTPVSPRWYYTSMTGTPARRYYGNVPISGSTNLTTTIYRSNARLDFSGVGVIEIGSKKPFLYPNPANGFIHVRAGVQTGTLKIFNAMGSIVFTAAFSENATVSLDGIQSGIYSLQVIDTENGDIATETFIRN